MASKRRWISVFGTRRYFQTEDQGSMLVVLENVNSNLVAHYETYGIYTDYVSHHVIKLINYHPDFLYQRFNFL